MITIKEESILKRKHLSVLQTALIMGVSKRTVYNWIKEHKVKWFRGPNRRIRVLVDSLGTFEEEDEIFFH
ncbi:MAG: helix-turn-helix domain-containing protein [Acidobacteriota bacterium]